MKLTVSRRRVLQTVSAAAAGNRPGAGGSIGGLVVAQAPADGYALMLSTSTPISIGPFALDKQP